MDLEMLAVELPEAGGQPKIVLLFLSRRGYFLAVAHRHSREAERTGKVVAIASRCRARSDGECGPVCVHGAVGGGQRGKVPGRNVWMRTICPCPHCGQSRSDTPVRRWYLVQKRMKLPGAWWSPENAEHMLALRVCRANCEWQSYWSTHYRYAA